MSACASCGGALDEGALFCPYCGTGAKPASKRTQFGTPPPRLTAASPDALPRQELSAPRLATPTPSPPARASRATSASEAAYYEDFIGKVFDGRYAIDRLLGIGGMGVVYEAHHTVIDKRVAVKMLRREMTRDPAIVKRFLQEAKAASRIGHACIVDVSDFGTLPEGGAFFVMEYLEGVTLAARLHQQCPLPVEIALPIVFQIAQGLAAAHRKGVVHRDLKPDNVFLVARDGHSDSVKLVDFGIAKLASGSEMTRLTQAGSVFGTPAYMAPEQARGDSDIDLRADIYALGTVLYELLVGHVPHTGKTPVDILTKQLRETIAPPRKARPELVISDGLEALIMKALSKDRDARFASMDDLVACLSENSEGVPLEALSGQISVRFLAGPAGVSAPPGAETLVPGITASAPAVAPPPGVPHSVHDTSAPPTDPVLPRRPFPWLPFAVGAVAALAGLAYFRSTRKPLPPRPLTSPPAAAAPVGAAKPMPPAPPSSVAQAEALVAAEAALPLPDASRPETSPSSDPDAPRGAHRPARGVTHRIKTDPPGGWVYVDNQRTGPDGLKLTRPRDTSLTVRCFLPPDTFGSVTITFGTSPDPVTCVMAAQPGHCVADLKNPFFPCP